MFKKSTFLSILTLFLLSSICSAALADFSATPKKTVGIFVEAPLTYVNNETVREMVPAKVKEKFPANRFKILPYDDTNMALKIYKEENDMYVNEFFSQPIKRADLQKIAKELGCDYAFFIRIENSMPRVSAGLFSTSFRTTVTCDVRLLDVATGKYIVNKQIVKDGSSTAIYAGVPSFDRAYNEALEKALNEIKIDVNQIK